MSGFWGYACSFMTVRAMPRSDRGDESENITVLCSIRKLPPRWTGGFFALYSSMCLQINLTDSPWCTWACKSSTSATAGPAKAGDQEPDATAIPPTADITRHLLAGSGAGPHKMRHGGANPRRTPSLSSDSSPAVSCTHSCTPLIHRPGVKATAT